MAIRKTQEKFINELKQIYKNTYNFSLVVYKNTRTKVKIICPIHGIVEAYPSSLIAGYGCPKCGYNRAAKKKFDTLENFIKKAREIHGDKYNYSQVTYINSHTKVEIICPKHGSFRQTPNNHLQNKNCPICSKIQKGLNRRIPEVEYFKRVSKIHNNKYDYSLARYTGTDNNITIICPIHGKFEQLAANHLYEKTGCPICAVRYKNLEYELKKFIQSLDIQYKTNIRKIIKPFELDIYLPNNKLAIEFNGLYWHSEEKGKHKTYHLNKTNLCSNNGINLIHIFEDEWINKNLIVKNKIKQLLDLLKYKISSNKCILREISPEKSKKFINNYCLNVYDENIKINLGIFYRNRLIGALQIDNNIIKNLCFIKNFKVDNLIYNKIKLFLNLNELYIEEDLRYFTYFNEKYKIIYSIEPKCYNISTHQKRTEYINDKLNKIWDCGKVVIELL